jgi:sigma-E factor negative regulatory protein RseC
MIEETGTVVALDGEVARVRAERRGGCGGCAADGACGTSLFDRMLGRRAVLLDARNAAGARVGERVVVGVSERSLLGAALAAYLLPIAALVAGAVLGERSEGSDLGALLGAFIGFALALSWLRRYSSALAQDPRRHPVVLRRAGVQTVASPAADGTREP